MIKYRYNTIGSDIMQIRELKQLMETSNFNFKKKFGQNFIIDDNIIKSIINKSNIDNNTLVIEIGVGAGALTNILSQYAKNVLCYEIDESLKPILDVTLKKCKNINIIYKDFLKADIKTDIKKYEFKKLYVVANLPYYITTPIIMKIIESELAIDKIVVMVQKEVGNRFNANPNTKEYNSLTIFLNYYFDIKKILDVSRNVFIPKPNVDSVVIEFSKKEQKYKVKNEKFFFKLIKDSFVQKRKTIKNNLKNYDLNKIEEILTKYNFNLNTRAEQIQVEIFVELANYLCEE